MNTSFLWKAFRVVCILSSFGLFCWLVSTQTKLGECSSDSLSGFRYALFLKTTKFNRGDIVFIENHKVKYVGDFPFGKRILGIPGDFLIKYKKGICVHSPMLESETLGYKTPESQTLPLLEQTKDGKLLTPLKVSVVPEGYIFVAGDHLRSFDSRYEEFGLVPIEKVWGKAILRW